MISSMVRKIFLATMLCGGTSLAQAPSQAPAASTFDVVTIRPSKPASYPGANGGPSMSWMPQLDGYRASNQTIWATIMIAYFPQGMAYWASDRLTGAPPWVRSNQYDIVAKVSEADLPEWKRENSLKPEQEVMFHRMLQSILTDRCKLVVHRVPSQMKGFALVLDKRGAKLATATPDEALPAGVSLRDGGVMVFKQSATSFQWNFFNATLADLAEDLSRLGGRPVEDKTGLAGRYNFVLSYADIDSEHPERTGMIYPDDPNPLSHWDLGTLGLRAEPINLQIDSLVLDHIEKPSEN